MRMIVAVVACATGVMKLHGANVTGLSSQEQSKWWLLSGSMSTFYDDNTFNQPDYLEIPTAGGRGTRRVPLAKGSFGVQMKPGIAVNLPLSQTLLTGSYDYTMDFFEARVDSQIEHTHDFQGGLNHKFSPRYELDFQESLTLSDRPSAGKNEATTIFARQNASNLRNRAALEFTALMSPGFGLLAGYGNDYTDYENRSYSQSFNNIQNSIHLDARWYVSPQTLLFTGYRIGAVDYFGPKLPLSPTFTTNITPNLSGGFDTNRVETRRYASPTAKNQFSHTVYFGAEQELSRQLKAQWRLGLNYADYYNQGLNTISPYVDGVATYTYQRGCTLQLGAKIDRYPTDTGIGEAEHVTLDVLAVNLFASVYHRFTERITGNGQISYQKLIYNGGDNDGKTDDVYTFSLGADYKLREYLWLTASYSYSELNSGRLGSELISYYRNYVSLGIRATY